MADILKLSDAAAIRRAHEAAEAEPDSAMWVVLKPSRLATLISSLPRYEVVHGAVFIGTERGHYDACQHAAWLSGDSPEDGPFLVRWYVLDRQ